MGENHLGNKRQIVFLMQVTPPCFYAAR